MWCQFDDPGRVDPCRMRANNWEVSTISPATIHSLTCFDRLNPARSPGAFASERFGLAARSKELKQERH
jgi:hypothetical protein